MRAKYYGGDEPRREPQEITEVLGTIIERVGTGANPAVSTLIDEWGAIAPDRWRTDARPVGIRRGVLLVEARSAAAATLLRHDMAALLEGVSARLGGDVVKAVRVRVSEPRSWGKNP